MKFTKRIIISLILVSLSIIMVVCSLFINPTSYGYSIKKRDSILLKSNVEKLRKINGAFYLYIGRSSCEWCQKYLPIYNEELKRNNVSTLYYFDVGGINSIKVENENIDYEYDEYEEIITYVAESGGEKYLDYRLIESQNKSILWQYVPILYKFENQKIVSSFATLSTHKKIDSKIPDLTADQKKEISMIINRMVKE